MTSTQAPSGTCPACTAPRRAGARFCTGCGSSLPTPMAASRPVAMLDSAATGPIPTRSVIPAPRPAPGPRPPMPLAARPAPTRHATAPGYAVVPVPGTPSRRSYAGIIAVSLLVTMIAVGATVAVVWRPASTVATAGPVSVETVPASVAPPVAPASAPDALAQLKQQASDDSAAGEATVGSWVPQLASKKVGMVADGQTWDAADVLAEHQQLRASYPQAVLVWSGDYTTFTGASYWVTVVAEPSTTAAGANAWCASAGLDADHCYAKRLAHSGGPSGNSAPR